MPIKLTNFLCIAFFILIASTIAVGLVHAADNPFDFLIKASQKNNPFVIDQPVIKKPVAKKRKCTITANDFVYMLVALSDKKIKARYEQSGKVLCFSDWLKIDAKENVKILKVYQQLQFSGLRFECNCGCVNPMEYNHYEVPTNFKIKTSLNLRVGETSVRCKCGCKQL